VAAGPFIVFMKTKSLSSLRSGASGGRSEITLHGYYHDEPDKKLEFAGDGKPAGLVDADAGYVTFCDLLST
jgi:hypothetical protein